VGPSRKCAATPRRSRGLAAASDTPRLAGYQQCSSCLVGSCACQACVEMRGERSQRPRLQTVPAVGSGPDGSLTRIRGFTATQLPQQLCAHRAAYTVHTQTLPQQQRLRTTTYGADRSGSGCGRYSPSSITIDGPLINALTDPPAPPPCVRVHE
jgi:hypothetical protein